MTRSAALHEIDTSERAVLVLIEPEEAMRPYADRMQELMIGTARASSSVRGLALLQRKPAGEPQLR